MRPSWEEYFMKMALLAAERSACLKHHVGAVAVRDKHVLTTGYNGPVAGLLDCSELGCLRVNVKSGSNIEICRAVHAEQNIIIQASLHQVSLKGATVYTTHAPCLWCSKALANMGIAKLYYCFKYEGLNVEPLHNIGCEISYLHVPELTIEVKR